MSKIIVPAVQRAVALVQKAKISVQQKKVPPLQPNTVLVKVKAVALNPTDWKHVDGVLAPGASVGCDFAGDIVEIGSNVTTFQPGAAVAGFIRGGYDDVDNGAFQEYVRAYPELIWPKPVKTTYEEAASMGGIALSTAANVLYHHLNVSPPWNPPSEPIPIIIWSGATSVGQNAIILAKSSGLRIATTASPHNNEFLRKLGADVVFDYKDPSAPEKIREWSGGKIAIGLDPVVQGDSAKQTARCFGPSGGKLATLIPVKDKTDWPENVEIDYILVYNAHKGDHIDFGPITEWYRNLPQLIETGKVKPINLKHWDGGLDGVESALQYLREGKTSAEKITLSI